MKQYFWSINILGIDRILIHIYIYTLNLVVLYIYNIFKLSFETPLRLMPLALVSGLLVQVSDHLTRNRKGRETGLRHYQAFNGVGCTLLVCSEYLNLDSRLTCWFSLISFSVFQISTLCAISLRTWKSRWCYNDELMWWLA